MKMQCGEILSIQMKGVYDSHIHLPKTKNSDALNMPLTIKALEFLDLIQHDEPKLIPQKENPFKLMGERVESKRQGFQIFIFMTQDMKHSTLCE
ncbi:hypothetical protein L1A45_13665 [Acinetobacter variabilis]|uniref:hypothetical protein n=1 Tax=Acinetobacter TaxID=469 RepID=UPI0015D2F34F|nr:MULTISPECIES: hypothetical protein [Acinetobacter]